VPRKASDRAMFLALHEQESDVDGFAFFLAEKLRRTVAELGSMSYREYQQWGSYYRVRAAQREAQGA
jgi:hypothetical protein